MFHKVKKIKPLPNYCLAVEFENNEKKKYDVKPLFKLWPVFNEVRPRKMFTRVKVDTAGYGIIWNKKVDLSCEELYNNGN